MKAKENLETFHRTKTGKDLKTLIKKRPAALPAKQIEITTQTEKFPNQASRSEPNKKKISPTPAHIK